MSAISCIMSLGILFITYLNFALHLACVSLLFFRSAFFFFNSLFIFGHSGSSPMHRLFSPCGEQGHSPGVVRGPLTEVAFPAAEHGP